ncbi:hypothetical protein TEA_021815 [Camellia sinensis var. sinensis]|uniref:Uncharacterized protein n=1 Tax=Camellia sinensis var. sinensis TaxID=542762 RepID=A0A4S4DA97_CAMSN|nr:hypothetical protein TEA_021815 [Camellia sinensis var. sinensis]
MANPRRNSYSVFSNNQTSDTNNNPSSSSSQVQTLTTLSSLKLFLKKPHAFPFLLSLFLLLTWVSLRLQHSAHFSSPPHLTHPRQWSRDRVDDDDHKVNLLRNENSMSWNPITVNNIHEPNRIRHHIRILGCIQTIDWGAVNCASLHLGEIRPGSLRGNHRHYTCNETFVIWGAKTIFRLENHAIDRGYAEVTIGADEVAVATSPHGTAHALINVDPQQSTFFIGCQDRIIDYSNSSSDFNVWKDL